MIRTLMRVGLRKGFFQGSRTWMTIGLTAAGVRVLKRLVGGGPEVVLCEELPEGGVLVISNTSRDTAPGVRKRRR